MILDDAALRSTAYTFVSPFCGLGKSECDDVIAERCAESAVTACRDHDVLLSIFALISHWRRLPACRQRAFPQLLAGFDVAGAEVLVHRSGDEDKSGCRDY